MCAALVLEEFPQKTEMESSMVASLYATILDQMEHQTDPDGSHMEVISRMSQSSVRTLPLLSPAAQKQGCDKTIM